MAADDLEPRTRPSGRTRPSSWPTPTGFGTGWPSWPKRPGHESFERRIYAHYALIAEILDYAAAHGKEMQEICRAADREVVEAVRSKAESGELRNWVAGKYES